jgi:hypothetical protein
MTAGPDLTPEPDPTAEPDPDPTPAADPEPAADPAPAAEPAPASGRRWPRRLDHAIRVLGFVVALLLAGLSAAFEAYLTPLYWDTTRLPVSMLAAVLGNVVLLYFTFFVTGRRIAGVGPALVWVVVMVAASSRTDEGDLVLTDNNWVGIGTMLAGSAAFAAVGYRMVLTASRPRPEPRPTKP